MNCLFSILSTLFIIYSSSYEAQNIPTIEHHLKVPIKYSSAISCSIYNPTKDTLVYYIDLDVKVLHYWGEADPDIFQKPIHKERLYQVLPPGARQDFTYQTTSLDSDYPSRFNNYRFTLYYARKAGVYAHPAQLFGGTLFSVSSTPFQLEL